MKSSFKGYNWVRCIAHQLSLVQKHAFGTNKASVNNHPIPSLQLLINVCKELVRTVKTTSINSDLEHRLKQEIEIRWDTYCDVSISLRELRFTEKVSNIEAVNRTDQSWFTRRDYGATENQPSSDPYWILVIIGHRQFVAIIGFYDHREILLR